MKRLEAGRYVYATRGGTVYHISDARGGKGWRVDDRAVIGDDRRRVVALAWCPTLKEAAAYCDRRSGE